MKIQTANCCCTVLTLDRVMTLAACIDVNFLHHFMLFAKHCYFRSKSDAFWRHFSFNISKISEPIFETFTIYYKSIFNSYGALFLQL